MPAQLFIAMIDRPLPPHPVRGDGFFRQIIIAGSHQNFYQPIRLLTDGETDPGNPFFIGDIRRECYYISRRCIHRLKETVTTAPATGARL